MIYNTNSNRVHAESDRFALCLEIDADYFQFVDNKADGSPARTPANGWVWTLTAPSQKVHDAIQQGLSQLGSVEITYAGVFINGKPARRYGVLTRQNHTCIQSIIDDIVEVL
jgi:hypothetical protein